MKIAFTIADSNSAVHVGGEVERVTAIVEIPEDQVPRIVKQFLAGTGPGDYKSMSISLVEQHPTASDQNEAAERLRAADAQGIDLASLLTTEGVDPQLPKDLVTLMRHALKTIPTATQTDEGQYERRR